uniref:Uncharacterized protein n=1 Tax=Anabas testudineus TaxID=64144 RepID=A0A3Q1JBT5_ANATE
MECLSHKQGITLIEQKTSNEFCHARSFFYQKDDCCTVLDVSCSQTPIKVKLLNQLCQIQLLVCFMSCPK